MPTSAAALAAATFTTRPPSGPKRRSAARLTRKALRRFIAIIASKISVGVSRTGEPPRQPPAQFTAAHNPESPSKAASTERSSVSSTSRSSGLRFLRTKGTTRAASRVRRAQTARPRFPEAPVTTIALPLRSMRLSLTGAADTRRSTRFMLNRPSRAVLYGGLILHTVLSTAAHAALLYALTPLFVLLLAQALLREFPGVRTAIGTLIALGGTLYVLSWRGFDLSRGPLAGDLLLLVAVVAWALYTAEGRALIGTHGPIAVIAWTLIAGTVMYLPIGIGSLAVPGAWQRIQHASATAWVGVGYLVVVTSVAAYLLWYWALAHLPAARVAVFTNLQPLATAVLAHFILGEHITPQFVVGAVVVISGVVMAQLRT